MAQIAVVVACFNMRREVPRTLRTLTTPYQVGIDSGDYNVMVVDNGSPQPVGAEVVETAGPNVHYRMVHTDSKSPAEAINQAVATVDSEFVVVMIDGARMLSPGVLAKMLREAQTHAHPYVYCPSFHLGSQLQNDSAYNGYDQTAEDALLATVPWETDGYRLFEVSNVRSVPERLMLPTFESNCFMVRRSDWERLGGFDERFQGAGGGLTNWEIFRRYVEHPDFHITSLLGEATFHQFHGGASTNQMRNNHPIRGWLREYEGLIGDQYRYPEYDLRLSGSVSPVLESVVFGANRLTLKATADFLAESGDPELSSAVLAHASRINPGDPTAHRDEARAAILSNDLGAARRFIDSALTIAPTQAELSVTSSEISRLGGDFEHAFAEVSRAIELDPILPEAWFELGLVERVRGNPEAAVSAMQRAISVSNPAPGAFHMQLALALEAAGNLGSAVDTAQEWAVGNPDDAQAQVDYADLLDRLDKGGSSRGAKRRSAERLPRSLLRQVQKVFERLK